MCGSGYNKIKNRVGTNVGRDFLVGLKKIKEKKRKNPNLPTLILKTMQSETHIFFGLSTVKVTMSLP
jgi:hypothetical protein